VVFENSQPMAVRRVENTGAANPQKSQLAAQFAMQDKVEIHYTKYW